MRGCCFVFIWILNLLVFFPSAGGGHQASTKGAEVSHVDHHKLLYVWGQGVTRKMILENDMKIFTPHFLKKTEIIHLTHNASEKELNNLLNHLQCQIEGAKRNFSFSIIGVSWGSAVAHQISDLVYEACGINTRMFLLIDGIQKPIGSFRKTPNAEICYNFYQRKSNVRGNSISGCQNRDLSRHCIIKNKDLKDGFLGCHMDLIVGVLDNLNGRLKTMIEEGPGVYSETLDPPLSRDFIMRFE
jgi:hypothetical protein